ncbi:hypothetical protein NIIDMKKI_56980 [Mycobacterium kansasii]|uniref:Oxidoreductase NAD-binding domain protein n=1 Tax=Mycobacterium kansasii TaxID=1768 RepID=A0A7G1IKJ2_MYCKA|nr:hypothetical protein NIIDMKKI_56980 [Mycobacterium kansasii]
MHEAFAEGDTLMFDGPRNAFYLVTDERDVLFVIGGIGVTPILPMIRLAHQHGIDWRAVYAGRSRGYMPLLDEVVAVAPDRVTVWADDERGCFPTAEDLLAEAGPTTAVYVCGPSGMLESVRVARGRYANAPLHYERFGPRPWSTVFRFSWNWHAHGGCWTCPPTGRRWASCSIAIRRRHIRASKGSAGPAKSRCWPARLIVGGAPRRARTKCWSAFRERKAIGWSSTPEWVAGVTD